MTNKEIIFKEGQRLAEQGKIKYTGRTVIIQGIDEDPVEFKETEQIHTFAAWKELGYVVKKGQKAIAKFPIWKYVSRKDEETDDKKSSKMFMKVAAFFSISQVEKLQA